ncbi:hypothetical protein IEO21_07197 [Rhodonia placenta]|uniref:Secreted protein n=1 Tax=Rhodonia placenta TaxID=104341 RepID=A0A8H7NYV2_9APHY|nr:hypothetical protein IEO21_07197 [Postia placenta]
MQIILVLTALIVSTFATLTSDSSVTPIALYNNNCEGSSRCSHSHVSNCETAIASVDPDATYYDKDSFSVGHCYMVYNTNGAGSYPVSGQTIIDTANTILSTCSKACGSYSTNNDCATCHVTLNYRA